MKRLTAMTLVLMTVFSLAGCGEPNEQAASNDTTGQETDTVAAVESEQNTNSDVLDYPDLGISVNLDGNWKEYRDNLHVIPAEGGEVPGLMINFVPDETLAETKTMDNEEEIQGKLWDAGIRLIAISYTRTADLATVEEMVGGPDHVATVNELNVCNDATFYYCTYPEASEGLSDTSKEKYTKIFSEIDAMQSNVTTSEPPKAPTINADSAISFETVDLDNNPVGSSIFSEAKLTFVNLWGTFCPPCIEEMPMLETLSEEFKEQKVAFVGIVGDAMDSNGELDEDNVALARQIMETSGVTYPNFAMNDAVSAAIPTDSYPTSILVDSQGNLVGEPYYGAQTEEDYRTWVLDALAGLE